MLSIWNSVSCLNPTVPNIFNCKMPADASGYRCCFCLKSRIVKVIIWECACVVPEWGWTVHILPLIAIESIVATFNGNNIFFYLNSLPLKPRGVLANLLSVWYANESKMERLISPNNLVEYSLLLFYIQFSFITCIFVFFSENLAQS